MSTVTVPAKNTRTEMIAGTIDKAAAGNLVINRESGGMAFQNMGEVMELAKLMAVSQHAVPPHCRNQVGLCLGLAIQAIEWRMSPYAVASKSYVVNDRISYESQLIHAIIEQRAPITCRLKHSYSGQGNSRRCKVWATTKGETDPLVYESPEFEKIQPKNSPLWKTKPDLQLFYNASRDWARMYFPDVIMGVYAEDELDTMPGSQAIDRPRGIAGLKQQLVGEEAAAAVEQPAQTDDHEGVDELPADEVDQRVPETDESQEPQMSAEEQAEMELLRQAQGEVKSKRGTQKTLVDQGGPSYE